MWHRYPKHPRGRLEEQLGVKCHAAALQRAPLSIEYKSGPSENHALRRTQTGSALAPHASLGLLADPAGADGRTPSGADPEPVPPAAPAPAFKE